MAWKRASEMSIPVKVTEAERKGGRKYVVTALVALLVIAGGLLWFLRTDGDAPEVKKAGTPQKKKTTMMIAGARPTITNQVRVVEEKPEKPKPQRVGEIRNGSIRLSDGTLHRIRGEITNGWIRTSVEEKTFKHAADVMLATFLTAKPGGTVVGDSSITYRNFQKSFQKALKDPIEFSDDDTQYQHELKEAVIDLRKELAARMEAGEDVGKIMAVEREKLRELFLYRRELEEQVAKLANDMEDQKNYEELIEAANHMLSERGVESLALPKSLRHMVQLNKVRAKCEEDLKRRKEEEEAAKAEKENRENRK